MEAHRGLQVVEQHVPSGGGTVENEQEVMQAHRGLQVEQEAGHEGVTTHIGWQCHQEGGPAS